MVELVYDVESEVMLDAKNTVAPQWADRLVSQITAILGNLQKLLLMSLVSIPPFTALQDYFNYSIPIYLW